jgi:putative endonuclease
MKGGGRDRQTTQSRLVARALGQRAETIAALVLRTKLFRILARGYRVRDGEIDIVAQRGTLVIFVEVKARPTLVEAMESITPRKRQRLSRAARHWLTANPWAMSCSLRADGLFLVPGRLPRHVPGIIELDLE